MTLLALHKLVSTWQWFFAVQGATVRSTSVATLEQYHVETILFTLWNGSWYCILIISCDSALLTSGRISNGYSPPFFFYYQCCKPGYLVCPSQARFCMPMVFCSSRCNLGEEIQILVQIVVIVHLFFFFFINIVHLLGFTSNVTCYII